MSLFSLAAHVQAAHEINVSVEGEGSAYTVSIDGTPRRTARRPNQALSWAVDAVRDHFKAYLRDASRQEWGLRVTVGGWSFPFGHWPLSPGPSTGRQPPEAAGSHME